MSPEWREGANFTSSVSPVFKSRNCKYIFRFPLSRDRPRVPCRPGPEYCFCLILLDRHTRTVCCVVVCVCVLSFHLFWTLGLWTYQPGPHRRKVTEDFSSTSSFSGACLYFSREKDSAVPFLRRPWSRILCPNELIALYLLGIFFILFLFYFCEEKS